jgi:GNAT superfamily N-acetyltransferase
MTHDAPSAEEYVALRRDAGMKPRSVASAEKGLPHSLFWVCLREEGRLIGMGRVVGDGGTVVQVTDMAIHPDYQGKAYGKWILEAIQEYILKEIPADAFACLFVEPAKMPFYEQHGYRPSEGLWSGMYWPCADRANAPF